MDPLSPLDPPLLAALSAFTNELTTIVADFSGNESEFTPSILTTNVGKLHALKVTTSLEFDLRPLPGQDIDRLLAHLSECVEQLQTTEITSAHLEIKRHNPIFCTPYNTDILTTALTVLAEVGLPLDITT